MGWEVILQCVWYCDYRQLLPFSYIDTQISHGRSEGWQKRVNKRGGIFTSHSSLSHSKYFPTVGRSAPVITACACRGPCCTAKATSCCFKWTNVFNGWLDCYSTHPVNFKCIYIFSLLVFPRIFLSLSLQRTCRDHNCPNLGVIGFIWLLL